VSCRYLTFDQQVLASYRNEPHKFELETDSFEGTLTLTQTYYRELDEAGNTDEWLSLKLRFSCLLTVPQKPGPRFNNLFEIVLSVHAVSELQEPRFRAHHEWFLGHRTSTLSIVLPSIFTDGSIMAFDTGSNAYNIASDRVGLKPEDFQVSFHLTWVPPIRPK
jgi:hypothetical protein